MAGKLVNSLKSKFEPHKYEDSYRDAVLRWSSASARARRSTVRARAQGRAGRSRGGAGGQPWLGPLWTGSLSFGLVNVPVQLVSAVRDLDLHFRQMHEKDDTLIETHRVCSSWAKRSPMS